MKVRKAAAVATAALVAIFVIIGVLSAGLAFFPKLLPWAVIAACVVLAWREIYRALRGEHGKNGG